MRTCEHGRRLKDNEKARSKGDDYRTERIFWQIGPEERNFRGMAPLKIICGAKPGGNAISEMANLQQSR
jgi:hypothetical protein